MQPGRFVTIGLLVALALLVSVGGAAAAPPGPADPAAKQGAGTGAPPGPPVDLVCTPLPPNIIQDGSFEAGSPNPYWQEFSSNFGTPLCTAGTCGTGGGTAGPHTGSWWAWFGGFLGGPEIGYLRQTVTIPSGIAVLKYWLWIGTAATSGNDFLDVMIDNTVVAHYTIADQPQFAVYTPVQLNVSQFANGQQHQVRFESTVDGIEVTNFSLDDVELCAGAPTSVALVQFEAESAPVVSPAWLLVLALPAAVGGLLLRRRTR